MEGRKLRAAVPEIPWFFTGPVLATKEKESVFFLLGSAFITVHGISLSSLPTLSN